MLEISFTHYETDVLNYSSGICLFKQNNISPAVYMINYWKTSNNQNNVSFGEQEAVLVVRIQFEGKDGNKREDK